ncbi:Gfo/Idh/MocA family oxidoreductase [Candidatus Binatia bacterium]|nr:Gfo/Idh/MocA family oxidoreductase [Candidatus Binatia bacterium]
MATLASAPLPIGLIGLGKHGIRYLTHLRTDVPGLRVAALCRKDAAAGAATAREIGAAFHADYEDLIADSRVAAVISVVPPTENERIVAAAVRAGKPLLLEKPFSASLAAGIRQRDLLVASGLPCLVSQTLRFTQVVREVRRQLPSLGRLHQIVLGQSFEPTRLGWLDDPALSGGGNILHTGIHMFDLLRHLSGGEITRVGCTATRVTTRLTEDSFAASMEIDVGDGPPLLAAVTGARTTPSRYGQLRVIGAAGQIVADHVHGRVARIDDRVETPLLQVESDPTVVTVLSEFERVARGLVVPSVDAGEGLAAVAIADACYRSVASGRFVANWPREDA